jgi:tetratricopeptide (TPR) repeat protein
VPRILSFKRLAIIYEKQERYEDALDVCDQALEIGTADGTKGGFEGRKKTTPQETGGLIRILVLILFLNPSVLEVYYKYTTYYEFHSTWIVVTVVIGDCNDELETQHKEHRNGRHCLC